MDTADIGVPGKESTFLEIKFIQGLSRGASYISEKGRKFIRNLGARLGSFPFFRGSNDFGKHTFMRLTN